MDIKQELNDLKYIKLLINDADLSDIPKVIAYLTN